MKEKDSFLGPYKIWGMNYQYFLKKLNSNNWFLDDSLINYKNGKKMNMFFMEGFFLLLIFDLC